MTGNSSGEARVEALRGDIERTRHDLGETVEALTAKADVKARASEAVADAKERAAEAVTDAVSDAKAKTSEVATRAKERSGTLIAVGAALLAFAAVVVRQRRRAAARRKVTPQALADEWRRQWKAHS